MTIVLDATASARVDAADRKIGLSRKRLTWEGDLGEDAETGEEVAATPSAKAKPELRGGTGSGAPQQLISTAEGGDKK
mgnify:CR=1 FL=1